MTYRTDELQALRLDSREAPATAAELRDENARKDAEIVRLRANAEIAQQQPHADASPIGTAYDRMVARHRDAWRTTNADAAAATGAPSAETDPIEAARARMIARNRAT